MTPLAARMFRQAARYRLKETAALLLNCQFFECSSIFPLASEMMEADHAERKVDGNWLSVCSSTDLDGVSDFLTAGNTPS